MAALTFSIYCLVSAFTMTGLPLRIVVGLGNPGPEHLVTRHNAGFWFVELGARRQGHHFSDYSKYSGETARITLSEQDIVLFNQTMYMTQIAVPVRHPSDFYKFR